MPFGTDVRWATSAQKALIFLLREIFLKNRVLSCLLSLHQALHLALGSLRVEMELLALGSSQSSRVQSLLHSTAVSLLPELQGPHLSVKNGGGYGKRHSLGVCFGDRGLLDKRRGGISNTKARRSDRRCRIWELDTAGLRQVVCGCASGISDLSGSDQLSPILKQFCSSKFSVSLCGVTTYLAFKTRNF